MVLEWNGRIELTSAFKQLVYLGEKFCFFTEENMDRTLLKAVLYFVMVILQQFGNYCQIMGYY